MSKPVGSIATVERSGGDRASEGPLDPYNTPGVLIRIDPQPLHLGVRQAGGRIWVIVTSSNHLPPLGYTS